MSRLNLFVGGRLKASVEDTPEGRVEIDKLALLASESSDDVVVRKGTDQGNRAARADALAPRSVRTGSVPLRSPTPTGNVCNSCVPVFSIGPSGKRLRHAWDCRLKAGQPISASAYAQGRQWHPAQGRR